jgi:hypothetical protein
LDFRWLGTGNSDHIQGFPPEQRKLHLNTIKNILMTTAWFSYPRLMPYYRRDNCDI